MTNLTVQKPNDASILNYGASATIVSSFDLRGIPQRNMPLGGLQRRLFESVNTDSVSLEQKSPRSKSFNVSLNDVYVGEIRYINGSWGWRRAKADRTYPSRREAAIAYVKWAICDTWPTLCDRFQGVA